MEKPKQPIEPKELEEQKPREQEKHEGLKGLVLRNKYYLVFLLALIVFVAVFYYWQGIEEYDYVVTEQGVKVKSNEFTPQEMLLRASKRTRFIVSPELASDSAGPEVGRTLALMQGVLAYYGKDVASLLRVTEKGELTECYTNRGDTKTSEEISVGECLAMLGDEAYYVIRIDSSSKARAPELVLEPTGLTARARDASEMYSLGNFTLNLLFPYYEEAVNEMNRVVSDLNVGDLNE